MASVPWRTTIHSRSFMDGLAWVTGSSLPVPRYAPLSHAGRILARAHEFLLAKIEPRRDGVPP